MLTNTIDAISKIRSVGNLTRPGFFNKKFTRKIQKHLQIKRN